MVSETLDEHISDVKRTLQTMKENNLCVSMEKCAFHVKELRVLGHIVNVGEHSIKADPMKVESLLQADPPSAGKSMERFLGSIGFLRDFVPSFTHLVTPLSYLRDPSARYNDEAKAAFNDLKHALAHTVDLKTPLEGEQFHLATDASCYGVGSILYQLEQDGSRRYIQMEAKRLTSAQANYPANRRELLALVFALKKAHYFIAVTSKPTIVYSDHQAISYLHTSRTSTPMLDFWARQISNYHIKIVHRPGVENVVPDILSRLYRKASPPPTTTSSSPVTSEDGGSECLVASNDGKLFSVEMKSDKIDPGTDREAVIQRMHKLGHASTGGLVKRLISNGFFWQGMKADAAKIASSCQTCWTEDIRAHGFVPPKWVMEDAPGGQFAIDLLGPLTTTAEGHNYILVVVDVASRFTITRPLRTKAMNDVAPVLTDVLLEYGFPNTIRSDRGKEFVNHLLKELFKQLEVDRKLTPSYDPKSNGTAEAHVKLIRAAVKKIRLDRNLPERVWDSVLPLATFCVNQRIPERTDTAPFDYFFGSPCSEPFEVAHGRKLLK